MKELFPVTSTSQMIQCAEQQDMPKFLALRKVDREIQELIRSFNFAIEKMFIENGPISLSAFTTREGLIRFKEKFQNWKEQHIVGLKMQSCQFLAFTLDTDGHSAQVFTYEKWLFCYENQKEVPTLGSVDGYTIHLDEGQWKVDSVTFYAPNQNPE